MASGLRKWVITPLSGRSGPTEEEGGLRSGFTGPAMNFKIPAMEMKQGAMQWPHGILAKSVEGKKKGHKKLQKQKPEDISTLDYFSDCKKKSLKEQPVFGGVCFRFNLFPPFLLEGRRTCINATLFLP